MIPRWLADQTLPIRTGLLVFGFVLALYVVVLSVYILFLDLSPDTGALVAQLVLQPIGWGFVSALLAWAYQRLFRS